MRSGAVRTRLILVALAAAGLVAPLAGRQTPAAMQHAIPPPEARVDINHASVDDLMKVPGMTQTWAGRIVRFRPYRTKQDLVEQGVVTSQVYDRIKDYVIAHHHKVVDK